MALCLQRLLGADTSAASALSCAFWHVALHAEHPVCLGLRWTPNWCTHFFTRFTGRVPSSGRFTQQTSAWKWTTASKCATLSGKNLEILCRWFKSKTGNLIDTWTLQLVVSQKLLNCLWSWTKLLLSYFAQHNTNIWLAAWKVFVSGWKMIYMKE